MTTALSNDCRFCKAPLVHSVLDLGDSPLANHYPSKENLEKAESFYPLNAMVCEQCYLVQLGYSADPHQLFDEYAYFSSHASSWLAHTKNYVKHMMENYKINSFCRVLEIGSNDGYLLKEFMQHGVPVIGVEPAKNLAKIANEKGVTTKNMFFGLETAKKLFSEGVRAELIVGNNILGHVPDINDFIKGICHLLSPRGIVTIEFPHLQKLLENIEFDAIHHEHFSYLSLTTVEKIFKTHGLTVFNAEQLPTHGGSLRVYAKLSSLAEYPVSANVAAIKALELKAGLNDLNTYSKFRKKVENTKDKLVNFLNYQKKLGKSVVGYGAPMTGNTLLNYCGISKDLISFTVDKDAYKQGKFLPGTHIPVESPDKIFEMRPDFVLILPWGLKDEVILEMKEVRSWGGQFLVPIPDLKIV